jgi:hypothetical protein
VRCRACATKANACTGLLQVLVNDGELYRLVEEVAEHRPIRMFAGRVYRVVPDRPQIGEER